MLYFGDLVFGVGKIVPRLQFGCVLYFCPHFEDHMILSFGFRLSPQIRLEAFHFFSSSLCLPVYIHLCVCMCVNECVHGHACIHVFACVEVRG